MEDVLGPISYLAVEFPGGVVTGQGFTLDQDLVNRGIVRVLDLEFVAKSTDGSVRTVALGEVDHDSDFDITKWQGASCHLLDPHDVSVVADTMARGGLAGILVYQSIWATPLVAAIDCSGVRVLGHGPVDPDDLIANLDETETA